MGTHAQLGVKFRDGQILGCYVHFDGHTMGPRIQDYLERNTITSLVLLIDRAQQTGGIRSFHSVPLVGVINSDDWAPVTEFLDDTMPFVIDQTGWGNSTCAESYYWLVDYETGKILPSRNP
jgi:hypothetical protein